MDAVDGPDETALEGLLDDMVGCDSIKAKLQDLRSLVQFAQARGEDPKEKISFNYLFLGKPGTGCVPNSRTQTLCSYTQKGVQPPFFSTHRERPRLSFSHGDVHLFAVSDRARANVPNPNRPAASARR